MAAFTNVVVSRNQVQRSKKLHDEVNMIMKILSQPLLDHMGGRKVLQENAYPLLGLHLNLGYCEPLGNGLS